MGAVIEHGTPLVDDPDRVGAVRQLGVDETAWLAANRHHPTLYATGLVDLDARILIDMVEGNGGCDSFQTRPTPSSSSPSCRPIDVRQGLVESKSDLATLAG